MDKELEEAAKNYGWRVKTNTFSDQVKANELAESAKQDFIAGAKWQAERMYTYDEMRRLAYNAFCLGQMDNPRENKFNGWIEQFKK